MGFFRGTKPGRDLESVKDTTVLDSDLVEYIQSDQELSEAYDEGKDSGLAHKNNSSKTKKPRLSAKPLKDLKT